MTDFILIDGSYYIFYRFFALINWWKLAKKDTPLDNPSENIEFIDKFKTTFTKKIKELCKKLKLDNPVILVGKDCSRKSIWRMEIFSQYKGTRDNYEDNPATNPGAFFKLAYEENLFQEAGGTVLSHNHLEADDCIALTIKYIKKIYPDSQSYIIASDHDYFQLLTHNVFLYNLKYKQVNTIKNSYGDIEKDLFVKCVIGDTSDNIPGVFNKCGQKTAAKLFDDKQLFNNKCKRENVESLFKRNKQIIDFDYIPDELKFSFYKNVLQLSDENISIINIPKM